jgi:hypothetical protein
MAMPRGEGGAAVCVNGPLTEGYHLQFVHKFPDVQQRSPLATHLSLLSDGLLTRRERERERERESLWFRGRSETSDLILLRVSCMLHTPPISFPLFLTP